MEKLVTKKNTGMFLGFLMVVALLSTEELQFCHFIGLRRCPIPLDDAQEAFLFPFIVMFFLSLITYKMKDEVFQAWFRFAIWFVPIIMIVTFLLNRSEQGGMGISGAVSDAFNFLVISIFYVIFIVVSLIRIALAYKRTR